jgi:hypothetical protein
VKVDISCRKCGQRRRLEIGDPQDVSVEEHLRLMVDRLTHRPSFECFGGHFELSPALPAFWEIHWDTLGE